MKSSGKLMSDLEKDYRRRFDSVLRPLVPKIQRQLQEFFFNEPRIDRVTVRAKSIDRFLKKANTLIDGRLKYTEPLRQIQDQIGARVVTYYLSDLERVTKIALRYLRPIESKNIVPDSEWEFGYFGRHFIFIIPSDLLDPSADKEMIPEFFELQVKTLFQHAWSEADHDLGYKPEAPLSSDAKRRLAFTSAQSWGADLIFQGLFEEQSKKVAASKRDEDSVS
jgi:putative GTP pyrophosphokinase